MPPARSGPSSPSRRCSRASTASPGSAAVAARRGVARDPDDAKPRRPGRALRPPPLVRAPPGRGRPAAAPRRQGRDRPADRERLLLRLRVPRADPRGGLAAIEAEMRRELAEGRRGSASEISARRGAARFEAEGEPYKVELVDTAEGDISLYTQGDFTDLCRGPHVQDSTPIKAFKLTGVAGAYWRGDEQQHAAAARSTAPRSSTQADLDAYLERLEEAQRRDHRRLGPQLDLFSSRRASPGLAVLAPEGRWRSANELEDLRRSANRRAATLEVKTPLIYADALGDVRPLGEYNEQHVPPAGRRGGAYSAQADELPGPHAALRLAACAATASCRCATPSFGRCTATSAPATLHGLLARARTFTQDDAHIFCTQEQIDDGDRRLPRLTLRDLYDLFGLRRTLRALDAARRTGSATDEEWDSREAALRAALERRGARVRRRARARARSTARRSTST